MIKSSITISNKLGLHARASAKLTKLAGGFQSEVHLSRNSRRVNAKSIMGVMMLAAGMGSEIEIDGAVGLGPKQVRRSRVGRPATRFRAVKPTAGACATLLA
jgi:phosphocarrier protein HPr